MAKWEEAPTVSEPNQPAWMSAPVTGSKLQQRPATLGPTPGPISDPSNVSIPGQGMSAEEDIYNRVAYSFRNDTSVGADIGGTIGGIAAPLIAGQIPPFTALPEELITIPLAVAGAFGGGMAGDTLQQKMQMGGVVDWHSAAVKGAWQGGIEAASPVVLGAAKRLLNVLPIPGLNFAKPSAGPRGSILPDEKLGKKASRDAFQKTVKQFEKDYGGVVTPAQMDDRWWQHVYDSLARGSWAGSEAYEQAFQDNAPRLVEMAKDSVDDLVTGISRETQTDIGEDLYRMFGRHVPSGARATKIEAWHKLFDPVYEQVDKLSSGPVVNARPLKKFAKTRLAQDIKVEKGTILTSEGRALLDKLAKVDDDVSLEFMRDLRSKYGGMVRRFAKDMNTDEAMIVRLQGFADDSIRNAATSPKLPNDARTLLLQANGDYARYKDVMERVMPYRLAEKLSSNPEMVISKLFPSPRRGSEGALRQIERVRSALTLTPHGRVDPIGSMMWDRLREAWATGLISKHSERGVLNTAALRAELRRYGTNSLDILLPRAQRDALNDVLNLTDAVSRGSKFGGGALVAKSAQAGGGVMIYQGAASGNFLRVGAGGVLLLGPMLYAKAANDRIGSKILRAAIQPHKSQREVAAIATRLARWAIAKDKQTAREDAMLQRSYRREFQQLIPSHVPQGQDYMNAVRGFGGKGF